MSKKLSVSEFISDKQLSKIEKIIEKSANTDDAYDKIENLLIDDFTVKDLGTNRLILINNKYDKYICKIAGDSHGIEANYREFYNGDLDEKRITKSYSISENGVFLVQEKVKPFTSDMMKKYKKDVRKMLSHLEDKLLLVDCKLSNFKNFGMRKNGDIVLLDHGDTIPLTMYENGQIVNIVEESNVSLRCKEFKRGTLTSKNPKPCGGRLRYSKNYDYFICDKCGAKVNIHDAYKEFYGDARKPVSIESLNTFQKGFDPEEYEKQVQNSIRQYAKDTMNNIKNKKENKNMKKQINGQDCQQIKGYWLPINSDKKFASMKLMAVKRGEITPYDYLVFLNLNPDDYKMNSDDHKISREEKEHNDEHVNELAHNVLDYLFELIKSNSTRSHRFENQDDSRRNGIFYMINIDDIDSVVDTHDIRKNIYYIQRILKFDARVDYAFFDRQNIYIKLKDDINDSNKESFDIIDNDLDIDKNESSDELIDDELDDVTDEINQSDIKYSLSFIDITKLETTNYMDTDCFILDGYYVPLSIINEYYDGNNFNLPDMRRILSDHGYNPDLYKINNEKNDSNDEIIYSEDVIDNDEIENDESENLKELADCLLEILDDSGYNDHGYARISYDDMVELFEDNNLYGPKYIYDNGSLAGSEQLTDYAIDKIREFDYVEDITDYCAYDSYEIAVKGKRLVDDSVLEVIRESKLFIESMKESMLIKNSNAISILIKLINLSLEDNYDDTMSAMALIHLVSINYSDMDKMKDYSSDSIKNFFFVNDLFNTMHTEFVSTAMNMSSIISNDYITDDEKVEKIKSVTIALSDAISQYFFEKIFSGNDAFFKFINNIAKSVVSDYEYKDYVDYFLENIDTIKSVYGANHDDEDMITDKEAETENVIYNTDTDSSNSNQNPISDIMKIAISSVDKIELDLNDIKDKEFEIHYTRDDDSSVIIKINLYNIIKEKI